ncbi:hypothetical protein ACFLVW_06250 [Chloroflexota bacterium]
MPNPVTIVKGATTIVQSVDSMTEGKITRSIDEQSKDGKKKPPDCECSNVTPWHEPRVMYKKENNWLLFGATIATLKIGLRWEGNGCDVIVARPYLVGSASWGTSVNLTIAGSITGQEVPQQMCDCCEKAACVYFTVACTINPMIGKTRHYSGYIIACANGDKGAEWNP